MIKSKVINDDCLKFIRRTRKKSFSPNLTFLDPPFNQGKEYRETVDDLPEEQYWKMMKQICKLVFNRTVDGGSIYFMQREKNTKLVMETLEEAGWNYQNLIIWKKKTSAVPQNYKYSLSYQIIAYAIKVNSAKTFNKLRINPPRLITEKYERPDGMYVTDV
jgi:DNA modification methylase